MNDPTDFFKVVEVKQKPIEDIDLKEDRDVNFIDPNDDEKQLNYMIERSRK